MDRPGEPKVSQQEIEIFVEEDVLRLEVAMSDALVVTVIQRLQGLSEEESSDRLAESARLRDEIEQLSVGRMLHSNVVDLSFTVSRPIVGFATFNELHDIWMIQVFHIACFIVE